MKNVVIDCEKLLQKEQAHFYLAQVFSFPDYYGKNLDALFDCLAELRECTIVLKNKSSIRQIDSYGIKVLMVLEEAVQANPRLQLKNEGTEI